MPEGDTVHRAAGRLRALVGQRVVVEAIHPRARATGVAERLDGLRLEAVEAHGKNLLLRFEGGAVLRSHLGMSGSWRTMAVDARVHGLPWLVLTGGGAKAVLRGGALIEATARGLSRLGPDILGSPLDLGAIMANLRLDTRTIGEALLDQRVVSGIGNVWRSEALWHARISPWSRLSDLGDEELRALVQEAASLMRRGRRTSSVYRRAGRACRRCGEPIRSARQGEHARTVYWCPSCQRGKGPAGS